MEIILAIVVGAAVIFFGALISMGNERQRKAIDGFREQIVLWAVQDLQIKRERLERDVRVDDPLGWLNKVGSKIYGLDLNLQIVEIFENPQVIVCVSEVNASKILFSPLSPTQIHRTNHEKHNQLTQYANKNPLMNLGKNAKPYELSVLNTGILFDLELSIAWKSLTGLNNQQIEYLWMYVV